MAQDIVVIGAGPAGMTAAYESIRLGYHPVVLEKFNKIGGISRTEIYKGYRFDIGGHRFFTNIKQVQNLWNEMLNGDFQKVSRISKIYHNGAYFKYPLELSDVLSNIGFIEVTLVTISFCWAKLKPFAKNETFEQWVTSQFGRRLYETFFKVYTEKIWGMPCHEIKSDWAAQRINGLSLGSVALNALFGRNNVKSLIKQFHYPSLGPGMMWEKFHEVVVNEGGVVELNSDVIKINRDGLTIKSVTVKQGKTIFEIPLNNLISSMPLTELIFKLSKAPPQEVINAAKKLRYRALIIVGLIINEAHLFEDNWIYIHCADVKVGRIQNFKNWSRAMVADQNKTSIGMEYFCDEGDEMWKTPDTKFIELATDEMAHLGIASKGDVEDGVVFREAKAYPVYDLEYRQHVKVIQGFLSMFDNLQTVGRNGLHRYNNMDHSMLTAIQAAKNISGEKHDLWSVNADATYHENGSS
ncbi:Protoporphyrinogen oxidase [hydrothermal vent metagenome]|uniref:Protoporphyrinogen oxidase n=1 Tax=hydrothermal vent metagenome TaxID=652676 RepID=A0A3B1CRX1_9ZZZZ